MMVIELLGSPVLMILSLFIFILLMGIYWQHLSSQVNSWRYFLFSLRLIIIVFIYFLIIYPWFQWAKSTIEPQKLAIYLDNSGSVGQQLADSKIPLGRIRKNIQNWAETNDVQTQWYLFGKEIRLQTVKEWDTFTDSISKFHELPQHMLLYPADQYILISDGQETEGLNLEQLIIDIEKPIHTVGVGNEVYMNDLWIERVQYPHNVYISDSINIKIMVGYHTQQDEDLILILQDEKNVSLYSKSLKLNAAQGFLDLEIELPATHLKQWSKVKLAPLRNENNFNNNVITVDINIEDQLKKVWLISGSLSNNTGFIKKGIVELPPHELLHSYRFNTQKWHLPPSIQFKNKFSLIILDDFPSSSKDTQIFDKLIAMAQEQDINILYLEGPGSNSNSSQLISNVLDIHSTVNKEFKSLKLESEIYYKYIKKYDLTHTAPSGRINTWHTENIGNVINQYADGSISIYHENNLFSVLIQDLHQISLDEIARKGSSQIKNLMLDLLTYIYIPEKELIKINISQKNVTANTPVYYTLNIAEVISDNNIKLNIYDDDKHIVDEILLDPDSFTESKDRYFFIKDPGHYTVQAQITEEDESINSNSIALNIQNPSLETNRLFVNWAGLFAISEQTEGTFTKIKDLEALLQELNSHPISVRKEFKFSALSTLKYGWLLILLFSMEWYFRKRLGLL